MYLVVLNKVFALRDNLYEFLFQTRKLVLTKTYLKERLCKCRYDESLCLVTENQRLALSRAAKQEKNFRLKLEPKSLLQLVFFNRVQSKYSMPTEYLAFFLDDTGLYSSDKIDVLYVSEKMSDSEVLQADCSLLSKIDLRVNANSIEEETRKRFYKLKKEIFS